MRRFSMNFGFLQFGFAPRLAAFYIALFIVVGIQLPFFPLWLKAKGLDAGMIGVVLALPMIVRMVAIPVAARAADRRDALRAAIIVASAASVVGYALVGLSEGTFVIVAAVALASAAFTPIMPLTETYALKGLAARGRAYGPVRLWGSAAFIGGTFIAGFAAERIAARELIWLIVAATALSALTACALAPLTLPRPAAPDRAAPPRRLLRDPVFLTVLAAASLIQGSHAVYYGFSSLAGSPAGLDGRAIAALWALGVIAEIALFALSGRLPVFLRPTVLLMIGAGGGLLRWLAMAYDPPSVLLPWLQLLHGLSFGATHLGALGFVVRYAPPGFGVTAQGHLAIALGAAMAAMMGLSGLLYAAYGSLAYAAMALAAAAGGACALAADRLGRQLAV
jgi:PPP family 3-phenylpropionic acid transporter